MPRLGRTLILLSILVGAAAAVGYFWLKADYAAPGPSAAAITLVIARGLGGEAIGGRLAEAGVIRDPRIWLAERALFAAKRPLKAGEYAIPALASAQAIVAQLQDGREVVHRLTIPEGLSTADILALVAATEPLAGGPPDPPPAEGALLPETYNFSYGAPRAELIERARAAMGAAVASAWAARDPRIALSAPGELVTLASLVEKETAIAAERPHVAAVFLNRLRLGMRLQSDPTVIYALTRGRGPLDRPLTRADLARPDAYNTYAVVGLPPGPIANPGKAALAAAAHPAASNDLYFVADGSGGHAFAHTLGEHDQHVQAWLKISAAGQSAPKPADAKPEPPNPP